MFDLDKMKENLKSNQIDLPKYNNVEELTSWLIAEMEKRKNKIKDDKKENDN